MHRKYLIQGTEITQETYDRPDAKNPFDIISVYNGGMHITSVLAALETAYEAGRRHVIIEVKEFAYTLK